MDSNQLAHQAGHLSQDAQDLAGHLKSLSEQIAQQAAQAAPDRKSVV